jgi:phosphohistidine phosphatase
MLSGLRASLWAVRVYHVRVTNGVLSAAGEAMLLRHRARRKAMEIYILRHGDAVDRVTGGFARDADRPLTEAGRAEVLGVAGGLARVGLALDLLLTSPLVRAMQTAEIMASVLAVARGPVACADLAPGGSLDEVLSKARAGRRVMVVGHMPSLGELAGWLAWGDPALVLPLRTAGLCRIDLGTDERPGAGDLRWLLPPKLAARLA